LLIEELLIEGLAIAEWGGARSAALFLPHATRKAALLSGLHLINNPQSVNQQSSIGNP
jgi:hypothetical protein